MGDIKRAVRLFDRFGPDNHDISKTVEWVHPADLYEDDLDNHRDPKGVRAYKSQFEEGTPVDPIVADEEGRIFDGHHRWTAAKDIGIEEVPVLYTEYNP